jgi:hypothetical protein
MTNTDYCSIEANTGLYTTTNRWLRVAYGSFTAFHRSYTDDELYNNETDENIDIFKNKYVGRVVIATGNIKTDFTRNNEDKDYHYASLMGPLKLFKQPNYTLDEPLMSAMCLNFVVNNCL